jgi:hypothetical protein
VNFSHIPKFEILGCDKNEEDNTRFQYYSKDEGAATTEVDSDDE